MRLLLEWLLNATALLLTARLVPGFEVRSFPAALVAVVVIGLLNVTLGLLLKIVTFPLSILTLGLFLVVINALILKLAGTLVPGFRVYTFGAAFIGAIVLALIHFIFRWLST